MSKIYKQKQEIYDKEYKLILRTIVQNNKVRMKIADAVLISIELLTLGAVVFAAPNVLQLLRPLLKNRGYSDRQMRSAYNSLIRQKVIERVSEKNGNQTVRVRIGGKSRLRTFTIGALSIQKPRRWDRKWRIVMFDIPIGKDRGRAAFRFKLKQLGFVQFQRSVWVLESLFA